MRTNRGAPPDELLDESAAAFLLAIKPATLRVWRSTCRYDLPYIKVGRLVRYRTSDLNAFVERWRVEA
jgi:hypothetical protein